MKIRSVTVVYAAVIALVLFFSVMPTGRAIWNSWFYEVQKADDATRYQTIRKVEDTARALQTSYEADIQTYKQYKNSDSKEKQGWGEQAKMRANKTAAVYNEYILKNSFVWKGNVPVDIRQKLKYVEE